mgnify:CR=1 FL=1
MIIKYHLFSKTWKKSAQPNLCKEPSTREEALKDLEDGARVLSKPDNDLPSSSV